MTDSSDIVLAELSEDALGLHGEDGPAEQVVSPTDRGPVSDGGLSVQQRKQRRVWLAVLASVYLISLAVPRANLPHIPLCWLNAATGFPCPTCGLTRAFTEIGHGHFAAATELNLLALPIFLLGLAVASLLIYELRTGRNLLCLWAARHRWTLILVAAVGVLLRYMPMILAI